MSFFDESFWVRVPWGKGRAPAFEVPANFTPVSVPCQETRPAKFTVVIAFRPNRPPKCRNRREIQIRLDRKFDESRVGLGVLGGASAGFTNLLVTSESNHGNWGAFRRSPMELMDGNVSSLAHSLSTFGFISLDLCLYLRFGCRRHQPSPRRAHVSQQRL